jgi:hypothetical protein
MTKRVFLLRYVGRTLFGLLLLSPADVPAEGIGIFTEVEYVDITEEIKDKPTGAKADVDSTKLSQLYDITIEKQLYPYLDFRAGGLFDLDSIETKTEGVRTKATDRTRRFFTELNLRNPLYRGGITYRDTESKTDITNLVTRRIFREEYDLRWSWRPDGFPSFDFNYEHLDAYDKPKTTELTRDYLRAETRYSQGDLSVNYAYTRSDDQEKIEDAERVFQTHDGRIYYSRPFFGDRLNVSVGSRVNYNVFEPSGSGAITVATDAPQSVFYLLDDSTPDFNAPGEFTTVDAANPLSNVDIGPNGPPNRVSFGLQFTSRNEIGRIHVLPVEDPRDTSLASRSAIQSVAHLFQWEVFSSDDQESWTPHTVDLAVYDLFENRFELSFSPVADARYIKVVTQPLVGVTVGKILIGELEAFRTISGASGSTLRDLNQTYELGMRWAVTDRTMASYEGYYGVLDSEPFGRKRTRLTNGFSLRHIFTPIFSADARFVGTESTQTDEVDATSQSYSASLRADHLDTFSQTLTYSGTYGKGEEGSGNRNSIFLRNRADLYRDWSMDLDLGYTRAGLVEGGTGTNTFLRVGTNLSPNRKMRLNGNYSISWDSASDQPDFREENARLQGFWLPLGTVSIFAAVSLRKRDLEFGEDDRRVNQNYSINWAPFPDGSLDFSFTVAQENTTDGRDSMVITPQVKWQVSRNMVLTLKYSVGRIEDQRQETDVRTFTLNARVFY